MGHSEFWVVCRRAVRIVVPELEGRIPMTWHTAPIPIAYYVPFFYMAYLTRRPDTYLLRLLLLPIALCGIMASAYRFVWIPPELNVYNWGQCLLAAVTIAKTLEYALCKPGMLKVGEIRLGEMKGKGKDIANGHHDHNHTVSQHRSLSSIPSGLYDAIELIHTLRGLKWKFGLGTHVPQFTRPLERNAFLRATFQSFVQNFLLLDLLEFGIKQFPGVGTPSGGSIFYTSLPPLQRYTVSTLIHLLTGSAILAGFGMVYDLITLIAVGCLGGSPTSWPPVTDHPWHSDSLHILWSKRWHQLLRQTFLVLGGYPGKWLAGEIGMILGTFIASGLFHECAMYSMGRGFDHTVFLFFAMQGPILILERLWRKVTGRRVGGWPGRLWVYAILFIGGQPMVNAWHRRGLGGGMVIPQFLSPTKILVPSILHSLKSRYEGR